MSDNSNTSGLVTVFETARTKVQVSSEQVYSRADVLRDAQEALTLAVSDVLPENVPHAMAAKFMKRLARVMREPVQATERAPVISLESEPVNPEAFSELPKNKGALNSIGAAKLKDHISAIYGAKPRGKFENSTRQKWIDKIHSERSAA